MYREVDVNSPLTQGDIIDQCPLLVWVDASAGSRPQAGEFLGRILVLTQACDLAQTKTTRVVVAVVQRCTWGRDAPGEMHLGTAIRRVWMSLSGKF